MSDQRVNNWTSVFSGTTNVLARKVNGRLETNHTVETGEDFSTFTTTGLIDLPPVGEPVTAGFLYSDGTLNWNCIQNHNRTADNPIDIPALFRQYRAQGEAWVQPIDQYDAYYIGDWVTHSGKSWTSIIETPNVWEPGVVGSEALWEEIV